MATTKAAATKTTSKAKTTKAAPETTEIAEESALNELFIDELKDIYWAEKALTKALPKMAKNATNEDLIAALENHLEETEGQIEKLEQVFESIGKKPQGKKCEAMAGLVKEGEEIMKESDKGAMRDAGIISAGQKVEHYEIATYGTLRTFAKTLGLTEAAGLLEEILEEEKAADLKLTEVAEATINIQAAQEEEEETAPKKKAAKKK
ncbi:MAG TPA: ferritin-like domain-containing protein [Pedobacter sp.]